MPNTFVPSWYVIYTRPLHEKKVARAMIDKKLNIYLPMQKVCRKWHDRKKIIEIPLFPSYIFVFVNGIEDYYVSKDTLGVVGFVKFGREIAKIGDNIINGLKNTLEHAINLEASDHLYSGGETVTINHGIFTGNKGEFIEKKNGRIASIKFNLLNRIITVHIPIKYLA